MNFNSTSKLTLLKDLDLVAAPLAIIFLIFIIIMNSWCWNCEFWVSAELLFLFNHPWQDYTALIKFSKNPKYSKYFRFSEYFKSFGNCCYPVLKMDRKMKFFRTLVATIFSKFCFGFTSRFNFIQFFQLTNPMEQVHKFVNSL